MAEWTHGEVHNCMSRLRAGIPLDYDETAELLAGYGDLLAKRDALAAELAALRAGLPRWRKDKRQYVLKMAKLNMAVVWDYGSGEWASALVGECGASAKTHVDQQAAMLAVTTALGLPPCEVEGE